jgi:hypothetical protein
MASFDTTYYGLLRTPTTLGIETTTASFPAYITVISTAEDLSSTYYFLSLARDGRFNSVDYPTENFDDIETDLGITLVEGDVFVARPLDEGLTKEQRQVMKLDISAKKRERDGNARITYEISELPTKYSGNTLVDNPNTGGLQIGRPWSTTEVPTLFSGLQIWYDTALASTINGGTFSDGTTVTSLTNRATGTNGAAGGTGREPTVQNGAGDTLNGYPVIRFATAGTYDNIRFTTNSFDNATGWTVVMLAKTVITAGFNPALFMITNSAQSSLTGVRYFGGSQFVFYTPVGSANVTSSIDPDGTWKIITARYDSTAAAASRCTFRWAKVARTVTNGGTPPSGTVPDTATYVETMSAFDGDLAEQIAYNRALSDAEIIALEDYLSSKWGV